MRGLPKSNVDIMVQAFYIRHMKENKALCCRCLELASADYQEAVYFSGYITYMNTWGTAASFYCLTGNCRE